MPHTTYTYEIARIGSGQPPWTITVDTPITSEDVVDFVQTVNSRHDPDREAKGIGWDRAHTVLCHESPCTTHWNPWNRSRA